MKNYIKILLFALFLPGSLLGQNSNIDVQLKKSMSDAWKTTWELFYHDKTNQFYDFISSYDRGNSLNHLPQPNEVRIQFPNFQGYGTGMEDCMISAGVMLDLVVDKYLVTQDKKLFQSADLILKGIELSSNVHGVNGFLARGVSPFAPTDIYINSSRDQYTHVVHGLWKYYNSALVTEQQRTRIIKLVVAYTKRMEDKIVKATNYDFQRANNSPDVLGISRMWNVEGHEAARLPMFYGVAWKMTSDAKYQKLMNTYLDDALEQSFNLNPNVTTYAILQMQNSMEVLYDILTEENYKKLIVQISDNLSAKSLDRLNRALQKSATLDHSTLVDDWRHGVGIRTGTKEREIWYNSREIGEALLSILISKGKREEFSVSKVKDFMGILDFNRLSSNGIFYLQAAYWKARRLDRL